MRNEKKREQCCTMLEETRNLLVCSRITGDAWLMNDGAEECMHTDYRCCDRVVKRAIAASSLRCVGHLMEMGLAVRS